MSGIDFGIVALYIAGMLAVGVLVSRRITSFRQYFVAGGQMTTPLLVCTLVSTYYGLDVLFGGSELAYQEGLVAFFGYTRPYYVAILVAALVIARRLKRFDFLSLPDVAAHFYGNGTRVVVAIASFLYALPLLAIMGIGVLLDLVLGIPFAWGVCLGAGVSLAYTLLGGLVADALTDTVQFTLMCVTLGIAAALIVWQAGGTDALLRALPAHYRSPFGTYPSWMIVVFSASALSVLIEPAFYQRIFAAVSYRAVLAALLIGIGLWAAFDWITAIVGIAAASRGLDVEPRYALLSVTLEVLPAGLRGLFVAGVLATAMSTIDSYLLIAGGNLAYDLYRPLYRPDMSDAELLRLTRWMMAVATLACVLFALAFRSMVGAWIFMSTMLVAAGVVPVLAGLYSRRPPRAAAGFAASLAGLGVAVGYYILLGVFGRFDPEWGARIWPVMVGGERSRCGRSTRCCSRYLRRQAPGWQRARMAAVDACRAGRGEPPRSGDLGCDRRAGRRLVRGLRVVSARRLATHRTGQATAGAS
ncbi:MAG: sodium:solute symporter family protein [Longimicrobiales bacterium]